MVLYDHVGQLAFSRQIVLDTKGGAWILSGSVLKHIDATGSLTVTRPLPKEFNVGGASQSSVFAVDPDGTIWVLGQTELAQVKPGATHARVIQLGPFPDDAVAESYRPPELRGGHWPVALASDGAGHVAVALDATPVVRLYNATNGAVTDVRLPKNFDGWSLRYFRDGRLAIGLAGYGDGKPETTAVIAEPDGSYLQPVNVGDSMRVTQYRDNAVLFGGVHPTILNSDGRTRRLAIPAGIAPYSDIGGVQAGRDGTLVVATPTRIVFLGGPADAKVIATYAYPVADEPCGPPSGAAIQLGTSTSTRPADAASTTVPQPTGCLVPPRVAVAPDGAGLGVQPTSEGTEHALVHRGARPKVTPRDQRSGYAPHGAREAGCRDAEREHGRTGLQ